MNPFHYKLQALWGDMDALGHINNASYFSYFEQARISWWLENGIHLTGDTGPVIIKAEAEYYYPLVAPCDIQIKLKAHSPGRSSYWIDYFLYSNHQLCTKGKTKVVWIDYKLNKSTPLPIRMLSQIEQS